MKKSSRRRRFFALGEERTPSIYSGEARANPGKGQPPEEELADEYVEEEEENPEETAATEPGGRREAELTSEDGSLPPAFALSRIPRARSPKRRGVSGGVVAGIAFTCLLVGGLGGFFWPKSTGNEAGLPAPANPEVETKPLTDVEQEQLDAAYAARHRRQYEEAKQRFTALSQDHPGWKWLLVERNRTLLFEGKVGEARLGLLDATEKSSQPAEANYLLAAAYMVEQAYPRAESLFAKAVALDPTRPEYYYLWGDCLRTDGKPLEAANKFQAALLRNTFETADPFYRLKLWLCQIEADQENSTGLNATLENELAGPHPTMQVLFATAAREVKSGNFKAALDHLQQARRVTDPVVFRILLNDPIFRTAVLRPEFKDLFQAEGTTGAKPAQATPDAAASPTVGGVPAALSTPAPRTP